MSDNRPPSPSPLSNGGTEYETYKITFSVVATMPKGAITNLMADCRCSLDDTLDDSQAIIHSDITVEANKI
jgi:hypothetical protein